MAPVTFGPWPFITTIFVSLRASRENRRCARTKKRGRETASAIFIYSKTTPLDLLWLEVEVTNHSGRILCCGAPFPVNLAYHWLRHASRETIVLDGERTAILPELAPENTGRWKMFVIAPKTPGDYLLQLTMVQEGVRWLEEENPDLIQECRVTVTPHE